ncbi:MAG: GNAT family N-acetyltransferase [Oscillospiraceae bacterium]|nr:GNAT family N-acetyltransferase [Oscillospiraceae bacterium]
MDIEIRKLSTDLLDDWLYYFDHVAFTDNKEWSCCYCIHYHWKQAFEDEWKKTGTADLRGCAVKLINEGIMQGYLAYHGGQVVGWCNANDKQVYDTVHAKIYRDKQGEGKKIKAIVCFIVAPDMRGQGIASRLLERVCGDAADESYDYLEAYPNHGGADRDYHGPLSMYGKNGFGVHCDSDGYTVVRKYF